MRPRAGLGLEDRQALVDLDEAEAQRHADRHAALFGDEQTQVVETGKLAGLAAQIQRVVPGGGPGVVH